MKWYYADGAEQTGPVSESQIEGLFRSGKISSSTLVWHDGMGNWLPFGQVNPGLIQAAQTRAPADDTRSVLAPDVAASEVVCSQCHRIFPRAASILIQDYWVCANCRPGFVQKLKDGTLSGRPLEYAGFGIRLVAKLLDNLIFYVAGLGLVTGAMTSLLFSGAAAPSQAEVAGKVLILGLVVLAAFVLVLPIQIWCLAKKGGTPGKRICKLRVISETGENLGWGKATGRVFAEILTQLTLSIGYLIAAFDLEKRTIHDRLAGTRVVKD